MPVAVLHRRIYILKSGGQLVGGGLGMEVPQRGPGAEPW